MGLVHLVLQVASVVSLFLLGPRQAQRKALRAFIECAAAESKKTGNRQSTILCYRRGWAEEPAAEDAEINLP